MLKINLFAFCVLLVFSAQCQIIHDSLFIEGNYRTFHFLKPAQSAASLVFVLHGSGGNGQQMRKAAKKLEDIAPAENILLVYPDGYKKYWNECRKTANSIANIENINENTFFGEMIGYFSSQYQINEKQVFAVARLEVATWLINWPLPCLKNSGQLRHLSPICLILIIWIALKNGLPCRL